MRAHARINTFWSCRGSAVGFKAAAASSCAALSEKTRWHSRGCSAHLARTRTLRRRINVHRSLLSFVTCPCLSTQIQQAIDLHNAQVPDAGYACCWLPCVQLLVALCEVVCTHIGQA